jgi:diguanylate cyclase (GGDEF)-like protein/PAS domain S-box-containing protein
MFKSAPFPRNEATRLSVLRALNVLDSAPENLFDELAQTAATLCEAPIALVSLIDENRQWFKSAIGLGHVCEMPRDIAFCAHVVAAGELMEIPNTSQDVRFAGNPLVTGPQNIRFYAGAPIRLADGVTLGSLCVIDHVPRKLEEHQLLALRHLAGLAARGLESRATALNALSLVEKAMGELALEREFLQVTLSSIVDAVITTDPQGTVQWMNPAAERATGWSSEEAVGRNLSNVFVVFDDETRTFAASPVDMCLGRATLVQTVEQLTQVARDGREFGIECAASAIRESDGRVLGAVLTFHDVSEQRRLNSELSHRALHDLLTGLPNRPAFESSVARLLASSDSVGASHVLMYIDLDQFKMVNDAAGHAAGDQLLCQISGIVRTCVRADDTLARLGGDEFGLLLERCDVAHAHDVAQKICDQMDDFRFVYEGRRFRVGASIGLVPLGSRWPNVATVMQAADASCYAAKEEGRNRVHVWRDSDTALATRQGEMHWVSRIELALDEDRFELHGQRITPIAVDDAGLHFEVLLRMREKQDTLTFPGAFLPIAERFHLATRIDRWVVRHAFEWMTQASRSSVDIEMMSINLSGQTLGDRAFHRDIVDMIRGASFDVSRLCFEITETAAITHLSEARTLIEDVRALGVKVALDDFGAGASSFGYIKSLPVDFLKIDGHFITNLLDDKIDNAAVRCFCDIAKVMGLKTIAEFVERDAVRDELRAIGVDMAQGYLIHKPEPLSALLSKVSRANQPFMTPGTASNTMMRDRVLTEVNVASVNPNRLNLADDAEVLLWADDLSISVEQLREIAAKVGPMRAAIRFYASTIRRAELQAVTNLSIRNC